MSGKTRTPAEIVRGLTQGLRTAAVKPNIYGYTPHEKQVDFHRSTAKIKLFLGGNRSGKTVGGATEGIRRAKGEDPFKAVKRPPTHGRVISVDFLNGVEKIVRPEIARWTPLSDLKGGSWHTGYNKELRTLTFENGSTIEFMSYDQDLDKFAGTSRDWVWFDEEPPKEIFTENRMRLLDVNGDAWVTMTPVEGMTWIYDDIYIAAKTDPNIYVVEVDMGENPHINQSEIEAFLSGLTADERKARKQGKFVQIGGLIYKMFSEKNILAPFNPPKEWLRVATMDHGMSNPTCWLWAAIDPDGRIFVFDEHYESGQVVSYHAQMVHARNREHGKEPEYYVGDPSIRNIDAITGTSILLEYMDFGIPILPGNNDVRAGINRVARLLEGIEVDGTNYPQLFITRNCVNTLFELPRYRWSTWATKKMQADKNKKEEPHKKNDHAADAIRYLVASRPQMDDGRDIPKEFSRVHASKAVEPYRRIDKELVEPRRDKPVHDPFLGTDW